MQAVSSLYIHFPFCRHLCNYCDFYKTKVDFDSQTSFSSFENYLEASFFKLKKILKDNDFQLEPLKTIFIGGGTPSLWGRSGANFLHKFFKKHGVDLAPDCEFTIEVNPGTLSKDDIVEWKSIGVNRFSVGTQALDREILPFLDRIHSYEDVLKQLNYLKESGINYSVDLMLGLPNSKERDIEAEIDTLLAYGPNHISTYILTVGESYKYFKDLPEDEMIASEYIRVSDYLRSKGFTHYEVSNFARPHFKSLHNLKYWNNESVLALGPSAVGFLRKSLSEGVRFRGLTNRPSYELEFLGESELLTEDIYLSLRIGRALPLSRICDPKEERMSIFLKKWLENGWIDEEALSRDSSLVLTSKGYLHLDSVALELIPK